MTCAFVMGVAVLAGCGLGSLYCRFVEWLAGDFEEAEHG